MPANRWRLRCYPAGTGAHIDRFVAWFDDAMCLSRRRQVTRWAPVNSGPADDDPPAPTA